MKVLLLVVFLVGCTSLEELEREAYDCNEKLGVLAVRIQVNECMTQISETRWSCMEQFPEPDNAHCIAKVNKRYDAIANTLEKAEEERLLNEYCESLRLVTYCDVKTPTFKTCYCISKRQLQEIMKPFRNRFPPYY